MTCKRYILRQLAGWAAALVIAVLLYNGLLYAYHHPAAWIDRSGSAANGILNPNSAILQGTEGRGLHGVDGKGCLNLDLPLAEDYVLVVGSSYVQGKEVKAGIRNGGNSLWKPLHLEKFSSRLILCVFLLLSFLFAHIGDSAFLYAKF